MHLECCAWARLGGTVLRRRCYVRRREVTGWIRGQRLNKIHALRREERTQPPYLLVVREVQSSMRDRAGLPQTLDSLLHSIPDPKPLPSNLARTLRACGRKWKVICNCVRRPRRSGKSDCGILRGPPLADGIKN